MTKEKRFRAILVPPDGHATKFTDPDGNERELFRDITVMAESEEAAREILTEREMKQTPPYHIKSIDQED